MTALSTNRDAQQHEGSEKHRTVLSAAQVYSGAMVGENTAGTVQPMAASVSGGLKCLGVARANVLGDGAKTVDVKAGAFRFQNSTSSDLLTEADLFSVVYAADDQTVARTDGGGTRSVAGVLIDFDYDNGKPVVLVGVPGGVQRGLVTLEMSKISSKAADAEVARFVAPMAANIVHIDAILNAALATADGTVTSAINGTGVTSGVVTLTQAASAAGSKFSADPSAANTVAKGDTITLTVGGGSTATGTFNASIVLMPLY